MQPLRYGESSEIRSFVAVHIEKDKITAQGYMNGRITGEVKLDYSDIDMLFPEKDVNKIKEIARKVNLKNPSRS